MKLWMEWTKDQAVLHVQWSGGRVEIRGGTDIFTDREKVGDPIVMFVSSMPRRAIDRSALMADQIVGVQYEYRNEVISWIDWHERVSCWHDGVWIGK